MKSNLHFHRKLLMEILGSDQFEPPMIIFVSQKKGADMLAKSLDKIGVLITFDLL